MAPLSFYETLYKEYKDYAIMMLGWLANSEFRGTEGEGKSYIAAEMKFKIGENTKIVKITTENKTEAMPLELVKARAAADAVGRILQQVLSVNPHFKDKELRITSVGEEALAEPGWCKAKVYIHSYEKPETLQAELHKHFASLKAQISLLPIPSLSPMQRN